MHTLETNYITFADGLDVGIGEVQNMFQTSDLSNLVDGFNDVK